MSEITIMTVPLKFVNHSIEDYAMQVTFDPAWKMEELFITCP